MAFKQIAMPVTKDPDPNEWRLNQLNGGAVYTDLPQRIRDNQSPDMLNMWFKERALTKRYGQEIFWSGLPGPILQVYKKFSGYAIIHSGTGLYKGDYSTKTTTLLYNSLTASKGSFFVFKNKDTGASILYYLNGHEYVQYDGTTVTVPTGYIPLVVTGRAPTGGGNILEQYNRLQPGFKNSFSGNGSATAYTLTLANLDATTVTCTIGGVAKTEGTDFTVNRTTGVVTFTTAPATGTDNVVITAYKTDSAGKAVIMACKYTETFGGNNDSRVFVAGDTTTYYYSGLLDPTYFPEDQYNNAGVDDTKITGFGKQYDILAVFKEQSLYSVTYSFDGTDVSFPMVQLSDSVGCDMPNTIQLINDHLVWCNTYSGAQILTSTTLKTEKDINPLSENINGTLQNPGLLNESLSDLQNASSIDFFGMYWLCVGSKVWAWDYSITPYTNTGNQYDDQIRLSWFPFDNINANCFFGMNDDLYYGDRTTGQIVHFINNYKDFGLSITAYWRSKLLDFSYFDWTKVILELRFGTKSDTYTTITTKYFYDEDDREDSTKDTIASFRWDNFHWNLFTWRVIRFARTITKRPKIKNTVYFAVEFSNDIAGHNLSILDLAIIWMLYRKVK
ncbi:hypothetical protein [Dehalobacter sp. TeCB1]|uniref:hypothetical protein n=1 Tax=Dehalobacter sp. TeCB1 TaxID=1843715 RepID=UPI00083AE24F|nr:hypothetical protein [Dehalobacter sp. TeCB1]OCZ54311.1 hypothetical protein A7D23_05955 [Dehalobacter sp. TeCB1]